MQQGWRDNSCAVAEVLRIFPTYARGHFVLIFNSLSRLQAHRSEGPIYDLIFELPNRGEDVAAYTMYVIYLRFIFVYSAAELCMDPAACVQTDVNIEI